MPLVEITAMTFGPYGIGKLDGKSVMVPNAAPDDLLEVAIQSERGGYSIARIERIVRPGRSRRTPPCAYLPRCGGCDWQQISYPEQLRLKAETIARELKHALGFDVDTAGLVEPAPQEFGYRSRVRLKTGREGTIGFHEQGSNRLVAIDRCIVADCDLDSARHFARLLARELVEIEVVRQSETSQVLVGYLKKPANDRATQRVSGFLASRESIAGVVLRAGEWRGVAGNAEI